MRQSRCLGEASSVAELCRCGCLDCCAAAAIDLVHAAWKTCDGECCPVNIHFANRSQAETELTFDVLRPRLRAPLAGFYGSALRVSR